MRIRYMLGTRAFIATILWAGLSLMTPLFAQEQPAAAKQEESPWKDQAEYDLAQGAIKETSPQKKIQLLQQWKEKYPDSKVKLNRLQLMLATYQQLGNAAEMKKVATEMTVADPQGVVGLIGYQMLNLLTISMNDKSETALADGEKAANGLLGMIHQVKKPEQIAEDAWAKEVVNNKAISHKTLGWIEWQRKKLPEAERAFTECLKVKPTNGEVSYWLGTVILQQRNPDKQAAGLYHLVRAASLEGEGAMPEDQRQKVKAFVEKTYINFHGSRDGLDEIVTRAKSEVFPAEGFTIESKGAIQAKDREKLKGENPQLYLWLQIKDNIKGPEGDKFFSDAKGSDIGLGISNIPGFKGKLITATPETNPKELQLSVEDSITPDAVIKLAAPLKGKADPGIELTFTGQAEEVSKEPYTLTFSANPDDIKGWPTPTPKKAAPRTKKAAPKKK